MDIQELIIEKQRLNSKLSWIDSVIREYIGGRVEEIGLISDDVKTPAFTALKNE